MPFQDERAAAARLAAGPLGPEELREIVTTFPGLRPHVAAHPSTDAPLLGWLAGLHDPVVDQALAWRASRGGTTPGQPVLPPIPAALPQIGRPVPIRPVGQSPAPQATVPRVVSLQKSPAQPPPTTGRSRRPLVIAVAAVAVLALGIGVAVAVPALFRPTPAGGTAGGGGGAGTTTSDDLSVTGVAPKDSAWQGGMRPMWQVDPVVAAAAAGLDTIPDTGGWGGRNADTVALAADAFTASGIALGVDADSGSTTWATYTQESCGGVTSDDQLRCWGGRMGGYPTHLVDLATGEVNDLGNSQALDAGLPEGEEDYYRWGTAVIGGVLVASWLEDPTEYDDSTPRPGYIGRVNDAGTGLAWRSGYRTAAGGFGSVATTLLGRVQHGILTTPTVALASETGESLVQQGAGAALQWVADAVLQGGSDATGDLAAPDGTSVARLDEGALSITTVALPPHPLRQSGEAIESFDPATGEAMWHTTVGIPSTGSDADGHVTGVLAAYHDGLVAVAQQPTPGSGAARVAVLQEGTGTLVWSTDVALASAASAWTVIPAFSADGSLVVESALVETPEYDVPQATAGSLTMFNATTGLELWSTDGVVAGGWATAVHSTPFSPDLETFDDIVVDSLDGSYLQLVARPAEATTTAEPPAGLPACPDGMSAVSWTKYADGSILLCRADSRYRLVFTDTTRTGWVPSGLTLTSGGFVVTFSDGAQATIGLGGSSVAFTGGGTDRGYVATEAWTPTTGPSGFASPPTDVKSCPTGSWPLSLSTWQGGWLLVCGTGSGAGYLAWSDAELGAGEATTVETGQGHYCAQAGTQRVCGYASPALVTFGESDAVVQRSVSDNWFPDTGKGGAGQGTGSYDVPAPDNTDADQVRYLLDVLISSRDARSQLNPAVADVSACRRLDKAVRTFRTVGENRRILLSSLDSTPVDRIPDGTALVGSLRQALEASRDADDAWLDWARAERANGCAHGSDSALYRRALRVNRRVDGPKTAFVDAWNTRIAPQYDVQEFTRGEI